MVNNLSNIKYRVLNTDCGQSLFEVIIAVGLAALILSGVVSLAATSVRNSSFTRNNAQATKYVQEELEWLRGQRDAGWDDFVGVASDGTDSKIATGNCDLTDNTFSWGDVCPIDNLFSRSATFSCSFWNASDDSFNSKTCDTDISDEINIVDATVTVSWTDAQGTHEVTSQTRFTNWR